MIRFETMVGLPVYIDPDLVQAIVGFKWGVAASDLATEGLEAMECSELHTATRIYRIKGHPDAVMAALKEGLGLT